MQPSFWFPDLAANAQPAPGIEVPFLPTNQPPKTGGSLGVPLAIQYDIQWPTNLPEMKIAQTLTMPVHDLPDIWNQLSVDVLYQQSATNGHGDSVTLFDPVREHVAELDVAVIHALEAAGLARKDLTSSRSSSPAPARARASLF